ncbi:cytochrome c biogenesis protein CcdA/glutaredoxin [Caldicoprobacter guelmensis]|uniref:hypothetical protein n=1 Tax=Caldicoprobacter guelmensis TaxID=1170224 RepID=UPI00195AED73|nr:hypothetical protein [Caldicoprobacter guelmensis]MBM7582731.1 cytochrome c biogenesis protein CcdA/glutaredoxin [Caldicoprobacter guelmensis]
MFNLKLCLKRRFIFLCVVCVMIFVLFHVTVVKATNLSLQKINIVYFYDNPCASCNEEEKFIDLFNSLVGTDKENVKVNIAMYNVFKGGGLQLLKEYFERYNVPKEKQITPILFINDQFLAGDTAIKAGLRDIFLQEKNSIGTNTVENNKDSNNNQIVIVYFYVPDCRECEKVDKFLSTLKKRYLVEFEDSTKYTYVNIKKFSIGEPKNLELIKKYFEVYKVPENDQFVPIVFIGDTYLAGLEAIKEELIEKIETGEGITTLDLSEGEYHDSSFVMSLNGYDIIGVLMAGLVNGFNPCSLSMLLFFLSLVVAKGTNILRTGFAFCFGKFLSYLLLGTLLFNVFLKFQIPWFSTIVKTIILVGVFIIVLINIQDYFAAKHEKYDRIRLQLPAWLRRYNHEWIKNLFSRQNSRWLFVLSFGLGAMISVGEFLCTGQIYLATIVYFLRSSFTFNLQALLYFILYDLAFIIPLLLVTYVIYKGKEVFDVSDAIRRRMPFIKLINAILFLAFGIVVLIWF